LACFASRSSAAVGAGGRSEGSGGAGVGAGGATFDAAEIVSATLLVDSDGCDSSAGWHADAARASHEPKMAR
jgi:hypothetical protein